MSRPATPKNNFLQTALIMITIFLGIQLIMRPGQTPGPVQTEPQLLAKIQADNAAIKDVSIVQDRNAYENLLNTQHNALPKPEQKAKEPELEQKKLHAAILVADTQYKAGIQRSDISRMRLAYQTLLPSLKNDSATPRWDQTFTVADTLKDQRFGWSSWSPHALYDKVVSDLSARNKDALIWGLIPGGYSFIDFLVHLTGALPGFSYAFAAFLLAIVVRAVIFPFAQKGLMYGRQMQQLAPMLKDIKEQYKDKPADQQKKTMELYQEYGINPFSGCGPALVQLPLFLTVYQFMLLYQFEFTKGTFLWINPSTSRATHGFLAPNLGQLDVPLIVIYGITMVITTLLTPISDPTQAKQQRMIGVGAAIIFPIMMLGGAVPVAGGFVLYWIFTNILATFQQLRAYRLPLVPLVKVNAKTGGTYPKSPSSNKWSRMMDEMREKAEVTQQKIEDEKGSRNGGSTLTNGSSSNGSTGSPAKHKPKKRK